MAERFTNSDIMDKLMLISMTQESTKTEVMLIKEQALKTNGRVNTIEQWMNGILAIDKYKAEHEKAKVPLPLSETPPQATRWFQNDKLVGGVVAVLLGLAGLIGYVASQIGGH